jgi:hypothetical protein
VIFNAFLIFWAKKSRFKPFSRCFYPAFASKILKSPIFTRIFHLFGFSTSLFMILKVNWDLSANKVWGRALRVRSK